MSEAERGPLVQAVPLLRRKLPAAPGELNPVPPFIAGTMPSAMFGAVVALVTDSGLLAVTLVTPPLPWGPGSPFWATIVQSAPSTGTRFVLSRTARQDEPAELTASSATYCAAGSQAPFQFNPLGPCGPAGPWSPVAPVGPIGPWQSLWPCRPLEPRRTSRTGRALRPNWPGQSLWTRVALFPLVSLHSLDPGREVHDRDGGELRIDFVIHARSQGRLASDLAGSNRAVRGERHFHTKTISRHEALTRSEVADIALVGSGTEIDNEGSRRQIGGIDEHRGRDGIYNPDAQIERELEHVPWSDRFG